MTPRGPKKGPKRGQNGPPMAPRPPKMAPRSPKMAPRGAQDLPKWPQDPPRWPQDGPKMAQDPPRWPENGPKGPKRAPKWPQDGPKRAPRRLPAATRRPKDSRQKRFLRQPVRPHRADHSGRANPQKRGRRWIAPWASSIRRPPSVEGERGVSNLGSSSCQNLLPSKEGSRGAWGDPPAPPHAAHPARIGPPGAYLAPLRGKIRP